MSDLTDDIERLRKLAEKATPGDREWVGNSLETYSHNPDIICPLVSCGVFCQGGSVDLQMMDADKAFLASCDPATITRLCDAASEAEALRAALEHVRQQAGIWKQEARTQKSTVDKVGAELGGIPDYGPIVDGVKALRADAERYRWLRDTRNDFERMETERLYGDLDKAIDAAIAASKPADGGAGS